MPRSWIAISCLLSVLCPSLGCRSPYRSDQGALFGGLLGAGAGAIIGDAVGSAGTGALVGAGLGAMTGATVGEELDEIEAQNRAQIAAQLGRQIRSGSVTIEDVVSMTQADVAPTLIVNHVSSNGTVRPLRAADLIYLQQQGVDQRVIGAMQTAHQRPPVATTTVVRQPPGVVVVEEPWDDWGYRYGHRYHGYRYRYGAPRVGWGLSYSSH